MAPRCDVSNLSCTWFKVVSYCPSKAREESDDADEVVDEANALLGSKANAIVGRRIHFLVESEAAGIVKKMVLTEAQVCAGINAAAQYLKIQAEMGMKASHPFRGMGGMRMLLHPVSENDENESPVQAMITGHETIQSTQRNELEFRILM